jgi:preprotein translocase subunit SecF
VKKKDNSAPVGASSVSVAKIMMGTRLSTTLRVFIPTLGLFGVGALVDFNFGFMPYGMIIGTAIGIVIAAVLVYWQIRSIKRQK